MKKIAIVDSSVLIPLLNAGHENSPRFSAAKAELLKRDVRLMTTHLSVAEVCVEVMDPEQHRELAAFAIVQMTDGAARLAGAMMAKRLGKGGTKACVKLDCLIAALAVEVGAAGVLAEDGDFEAILDGYPVKAWKLADLQPKQLTLPTD